jgi:predicted TIM-barrel enzyme
MQVLGGTGLVTTSMHGAATGVATGSAPASSHVMHHGAGASHGFVMSLMSGGHLVMLLAHLAAGIVVGLWLAAGERAFWTLVALTARPLVNAWRTVTAVARGGVDAVVVTGLPHVFRTVEFVLFHAAGCSFRYSMRTSCGVR